MNPLIKTIKQSRQSGNALVLWLVVKSWDGPLPPTRDDLAEVTNLSTRQVDRHLQKLIADGLVGTNHAMGRGQVTRFSPAESLTLLSDNSQTQTSDFIAESTTEVSDLSDTKSDTNDRLTAENSDESVRLSPPRLGKSDGSDGLTAEKSDTFGNPLTLPHKDEELNIPTGDKSPVARTREGLGRQEYIVELCKRRRTDLGVKTLPMNQGEGAAAKWMHGQGWPVDDVWRCYLFLKSQGWRGAPVTLITVKNHYPAWRKGELQATLQRAGPAQSKMADNLAVVRRRIEEHKRNGAGTT